MSEWGRDSVRSGGSPGRGRILVVLLLLLAIVLAGADIAMRLGLLRNPFETGQQEEIERLRKDATRLEAELADARARATSSPQIDALNREIERRGAEITRLKEERNKLLSGETESAVSLRAENEQLRTVQIPALEEELQQRDLRLTDLEARLQTAEDTASDLRVRLDRAFNDEIPGLKNQIADRDAMLKQLDGEVARLQPLEGKLKDAEDALASAREDAGGSDTMRKALEGELGIARQQIAALRKEIEGLRTSTPEKPVASPVGDPTETAVAPTAAGERRLTPRNPNAVARAMEEALGLNLLDTEERNRIATGLIEGECVGKVLSDVFGRAPAVPLRDLIRALDSDC